MTLKERLFSSFNAGLYRTASIKKENITCVAGGLTMNGYVAYDTTLKGKRPAALDVHERLGLNNYAKSRARPLPKRAKSSTCP